MGGTITHINKNSFAKKMTRLGLITAFLIGGYGLQKGYSAFSESKMRTRNAQTISQAIEKGEIDVASRLTEELGKVGKLNLEDKVKFDATLKAFVDNKKLQQAQETKKQEYAQKLDSFIEKQEFKQANDYIQGLKANNPGDEVVYQALEKRLHDSTQEGFLERFDKAKTPNEKREVFTEYASRFSHGNFRQRMATELLIEDFKSMFADIDANQGFDMCYKHLKGLNQGIESYSQDIDFDAIRKIVSNTLTSSLKQCNGYNLRFRQDGELKVGSNVTTIFAQEVDYKSEYLNERNANFPTGSTGTVLDMNPDGQVTVKFDGKKARWPTTWQSLDPYVKNYGDNVGQYKPKELALIVKVDEIDRKQLEYESEKLLSAIKTGKR